MGIRSSWQEAYCDWKDESLLLAPLSARQVGEERDQAKQWEHFFFEVMRKVGALSGAPKTIWLAVAD
ncbi:MAG: hypothetical protein D6691_07565 [Candidatus Hydrogenedentota bacterium]|nr:MAG: hypothetical protein D6691_07565 [Candidatus Hydrogenedentota bacterium]